MVPQVWNLAGTKSGMTGLVGWMLIFFLSNWNFSVTNELKFHLFMD